MYLVFFGNDRERVRNSATEYISDNIPSDGVVTSLESGDFVPGMISDALGASSLFGGPQWFVLDSPFENKDFFEEVNDSLKQLSESANTFIILEGALLAPEKKAYSKFSLGVFEFSLDKEAKPNVFAMTEALATKNKKQLWTLLQEARLSGLNTEAIVGMLWWQLKTMRLALITKTAEEAGMKDFPYSKAKRALVNFPNNTIEKLSQSLLALYHEGHAGVRDMDLALEEWVLSI